MSFLTCLCMCVCVCVCGQGLSLFTDAITTDTCAWSKIYHDGLSFMKLCTPAHTVHINFMKLCVWVYMYNAYCVHLYSVCCVHVYVSLVTSSLSIIYRNEFSLEKTLAAHVKTCKCIYIFIYDIV